MNITLRPVVPDDLPIFYAHLLDEDAARMAAFTPQIPVDIAAFIVRWRRLEARLDFDTQAILVDGAVAGHIGSYVESGDREITYWLGQEFWGRGAATAAVQAFLQITPTRPLFARAAKDNAASLRVLEKNGFCVVGESSGFSNARGETVEESVLRLDGDAATGNTTDEN